MLKPTLHAAKYLVSLWSWNHDKDALKAWTDLCKYSGTLALPWLITKCPGNAGVSDLARSRKYRSPWRLPLARWSARPLLQNTRKCWQHLLPGRSHTAPASNYSLSGVIHVGLEDLEFRLCAKWQLNFSAWTWCCITDTKASMCNPGMTFTKVSSGALLNSA